MFLKRYFHRTAPFTPSHYLRLPLVVRLLRLVTLKACLSNAVQAGGPSLLPMIIWRFITMREVHCLNDFSQSVLYGI